MSLLLRKAMDFDRAIVEACGLLVAGLDPTRQTWFIVTGTGLEMVPGVQFCNSTRANRVKCFLLVLAHPSGAAPLKTNAIN